MIRKAHSWTEKVKKGKWTEETETKEKMLDLYWNPVTFIFNIKKNNL